MMRIGIFLPNWVGDLSMATPTLRAVRRHFVDAHLVGILRPALADVLAGTHFLDEQVHYDPRSRQTSLGTWHVVRRLRAIGLDTILLLTNSLRTALVARASGAKRVIGFARHFRSLLLTDRLYQERHGWRFEPRPVLDDYLRLAYALGCPPESPRIELATTPADESAADMVLSRLGINRPFVAVNSSGAFGAAKLWPTEYFGELTRRIAAEQGYSVLAVCGPSERETARAIAQAAGHSQVRSLAEEDLNIGLTKACVRRSRLLVTTDSGPRHFAAAFNVPVVTLFGPTHIAWSETHYSRAVHLQRQVPCGPCQKRVCPLGHHRCMRDLSVDEVHRAVKAQLDQPWTVQAA